MEVEGRQGLARLFDTEPLPYEERQVAVAPDGGDVFALAVDTEAALLEYLEMFYKLGRAGRMLKRIGAVDFATTVAPGLRDVLLTGKVYEAVGRRRSGRQEYDAVVLDAPPTGRITRFLNVNTEVAGLAKSGPIRTQSDAIMGLFTSDRTVVHVVTLLEEMPVQETADGLAGLAEVGLPVGAVIVNMVRSPALRAGDLTALGKGTVSGEEIVAGLTAAGLPADAKTVTGLLDEGADLAARMSLEKRERRKVQGARPTDVRPALDPGRDGSRRSLCPGRVLRRAGPAMTPKPRRKAGAVTPPRLDVDALLADPATRTIVCCGSGGVGKTTTAAALAVRAAESGRSVVVLTIDPAKRLAQSMGLVELGNEPRPVKAIDRSAGGSLDAMMLDMKRTFDEIVEAHSDPDRAAVIFANPFYQSMSSSFAGTQEYMAMEKLGQLRTTADAEGRWDLIIVDTPPSRSALDFLDAPQAAGLLPRRSLHAHPRGAGQGRRAGLPTGGRRRPRCGHVGALRVCSGRRSSRTCRPSSPPSTARSAASASAPTRPTPCSRRRGRRSSSSQRPSRTRCARRRTSSNGSPRRACRSRGWWSTGSTGPRAGLTRRAGAGRAPSASSAPEHARYRRAAAACTPSSPSGPQASDGSWRASPPPTPASRRWRRRRRPPTCTTSPG